MNPAVFVTEMREVAKLTQSQMVPGTLEAYEPRFASWSDEEFTLAIRKCGDELNRFPTVGQIRANRPKRFESADDIIPYGRLLLASEDANEQGAPSLEAEIDRLTDEELAALFRKHGNYDLDPDMTEDDIIRACEHSVEQFRRNPSGRIYRGYVREALKALKSNLKNER